MLDGVRKALYTAAAHATHNQDLLDRWWSTLKLPERTAADTFDRDQVAYLKGWLLHAREVWTCLLDVHRELDKTSSVQRAPIVEDLHCLIGYIYTDYYAFHFEKLHGLSPLPATLDVRRGQQSPAESLDRWFQQEGFSSVRASPDDSSRLLFNRLQTVFVELAARYQHIPRERQSFDRIQAVLVDLPRFLERPTDFSSLETLVGLMKPMQPGRFGLVYAHPENNMSLRIHLDHLVMPLLKLHAKATRNLEEPSNKAR